MAKDDGTDEELIATIVNKNLSELQGEENLQQLEVQQAGVNMMANLVKNEPYKFMLRYNTACNKGPMEFTIKFQFKIKMVANPL